MYSGENRECLSSWESGSCAGQGYGVQFPLAFWSVDKPGPYFGSLVAVAAIAVLQQFLLFLSFQVKIRKSPSAVFRSRVAALIIPVPAFTVHQVYVDVEFQRVAGRGCGGICTGT